MIILHSLRATLLSLHHSDRQSCGFSILNQWFNHPRNRYVLPSLPWALVCLLLWHILSLHPIHFPSSFLLLPRCFQHNFFLDQRSLNMLALFPVIVTNTSKSLSLRAIVVVLMSSLWLYSFLMTSSFCHYFVSTFGRRFIVALTFTCVECFFFTS